MPIKYGPLDHEVVWAHYARGSLPAEIGRSLGQPPFGVAPAQVKVKRGLRFAEGAAEVLDKPGALSSSDWSLLCQHTVIGERMFPVRIHSARHTAYVDWRHHTDEDGFVMEPCRLPAGMEAKLRTLMRALDLAYGAVDLVVAEDGRRYGRHNAAAGRWSSFFPDRIHPQSERALRAPEGQTR
jgi:hypothetical protein